MYTTDESDVAFRELHNMQDAAVRRVKIMSFANEIREMRAQKERELMLDAYNHLNKTALREEA